MARKKVWAGFAGTAFRSNYSTTVRVADKISNPDFLKAMQLRKLHTSVEEVYGVLKPKFKAQFAPVQEIIENKFLNAATRGVVGGLAGGEVDVLEGYDQETASEIVKEGLLLTKDEPINLPLSEKGTVTGAKVSRTLGKSAHLIGEYTRALMLKGGKLDPDLIADATRAARLYSFTPSFSQEIEGFNGRHKGHQAYDLVRIVELQKEKEKNGTHIEVWDEEEIAEEDIFGRNGVLFMRWMNEVHGTEKDIAAAMFPPGQFSMPCSHDEVMQYFIGCWSGARATALMLVAMDGNKDGKFMGYDEAETWAMARLALADVYDEEFWMPTDRNGNHTRSSIISAETTTMLYIRQAIDASLQGHLHRNQDFYWSDFKGRESFTKALKDAYVKSIEVQKLVEKDVQTNVGKELQRREEQALMKKEGGIGDL